MQIQKLVAPISNFFQRSKKKPAYATIERAGQSGFIYETGISSEYHVYGFGEGPTKDSFLIGAGNPATAEGAIFIRQSTGDFRKVGLPDETAFLSQFLKLPSGKYIAGGMSAIGRGALLLGNEKASHWESASIDLHPFSSITALGLMPDGSVVAFAGHMITQGKTKPVLFRSKDEGITWEKEDIKLPIGVIQSIRQSKQGSLYAGTSGDKDPMFYVSDDSAMTWRELPAFPTYKTYKMIATYLHAEGQKDERLFVVLWGYKTDIADRVVRIYSFTQEQNAWHEHPPVDESHFVFAFFPASDGTLYAGSEKGLIYQSTDLANSWKKVGTFSTNIGAQAFFEDSNGVLWIGKDAIPPNEYGLWRKV
ncbi:MAG: hypothetical protein KDD48_03225 [Bdellovibrionales bacterium]|nr:hypothetical protein [Bdellovibrionales bacterium]